MNRVAEGIWQKNLGQEIRSRRVPISLRVPVRRISQDEFGELSYEVMRHVFLIHNEIGRFFDERIYRLELANRISSVRLEEPIKVSFESFHKEYFIDVLVQESAPFEFKAVDALVPRHRAQLINYLLLCDLSHGKLVNVRPEEVKHEFVNSQWRRHDRCAFTVENERWNANIPGSHRLEELLVPLLRDWGAGLEIALYEEAVVHFFAEPDDSKTGVIISGREVSRQPVRLIAPGIAFKITAFDKSLDAFERHARRFLDHTTLHAVAWVNVTMKTVTFTSLER
jgi:GxxExxY protein